MKNLLSTVAIAAALAGAGGAQAALITFDMPGVVAIDPVTSVATYSEAMFNFSGAAASFLPLDGVGRGGTGGLFVLANAALLVTPGSGGLFYLSSLDYGTIDGLIATPPTSLLVEGFLSDNTLLSEMLNLGMQKSFSFTGWTGLASLRLTANGDFVLDNLALTAVPEPAGWALVGLALAGLGLSQRRRGVAPGQRA